MFLHLAHARVPNVREVSLSVEFSGQVIVSVGSAAQREGFPSCGLLQVAQIGLFQRRLTIFSGNTDGLVTVVFPVVQQLVTVSVEASPGDPSQVAYASQGGALVTSGFVSLPAASFGAIWRGTKGDTLAGPEYVELVDLAQDQFPPVLCTIAGNGSPSWTWTRAGHYVAVGCVF